MTAQHSIRFGIVGCGAIGPTHAGAIAQIAGAQLIAVADLKADRAKTLADKFGVKRVYATDDELLADTDVDVVCLCTPSGMHADGAVAALRAGKHVVIEKPMDVSLDACDRIIAAERETGRLVTIISQHRFDPATRVVKDLVAAGSLGNIVLATADVKWWRTQGYYDEGDWRGTFALDGGGALMNQGVHTVDLLQYLAGDVESVFAHVRTGAHTGIEVEDAAVLALTFRNGAIGTLVATTAAYEGLPVRIDLFGTDGTAILEGDRLKTITLKNGQTWASEEAAAHALSVAKGGTASVREETKADRPNVAPAGAVWGDAHRAQLEDFIHAIRTNQKPLIDAAEGKKPVEIILAAYESARTERVVRVGENTRMEGGG